MIPKIFHLTSKNDKLPHSFQLNLKQIQNYYPDYEIRIHDDTAIHQFVTKHFPGYYGSTFKRMPQTIMQVDTVRYMWMYVYGGIYCDFDIYFLKPLNFTQGVIFFEREWTYPTNDAITTSVHNCCFASEPNHPIWLELLDGIAANVAHLNKLKKPIITAFDVTGPNAISKIITDRQLLKQYENVTVLPGSALYQKGFSKGNVDDAYVIHYGAGSWRETGNIAISHFPRFLLLLYQKARTAAGRKIPNVFNI